MFPVPCVPIVKLAFEVSVDNVSVLKVVNSPSVAWNSDAVTTPLPVAPNTRFCPATGDSVILPEVDDITLPSILMLSTFSCPSTVPVPVIFVGPVKLIAPVPDGSRSMFPFVSVLILPSALMFKSPTLKVPVVNDPDIVVLPVVATSAVFNVPVIPRFPVPFAAAANSIVPVPEVSGLVS